jgi:sulfur-carrier protein
VSDVITVRLFSVLRERVGTDRILLDAAGITNVGSALDKLAEGHPEIARYRSWIRPAVNQAYSEVSADLNAGDELALITPVSGG